MALKAATSGPKSSTSGVVCPTCPYTCARQVPPKRASPAPRSTYSNRPVPLSFRSGVTVFVMSGHVQYSWQPSGHHTKKGGEWRGGGGDFVCLQYIQYIDIQYIRYPVYRYPEYIYIYIQYMIVFRSIHARKRRDGMKLIISGKFHYTPTSLYIYILYIYVCVYIIFTLCFLLGRKNVEGKN